MYLSYTQDDLWLIKETESSKQIQGARESQFTLGNGYLSVRGIYEEIPYDACPGTYIAGIYDKMSSQVSELVNLPNPVNFKFTVEGEKLDAFSMDILKHKRVLNLKKAVLARHTLYRDRKKNRYDYQSVRFISLHNRNVGVMRIVLTALDEDCIVDINAGIDTSVANAGVLSEGRKRHFRIREVDQTHNSGCVVTDTNEKKNTIVYWAGFYYEINNKKISAKDNIFRLKLKKNKTVIFTKVFCIKHFPYISNHALQKKDTLSIFNKALNTPFFTLIEKHMLAWDKYWKKADVVIRGTANIQQNIRFNIYHLLICVHSDSGFSSIGARSLSGEGYRGHIFWDAEIFMLPFYLFTFPKVAKNMLLYRYKRLAAARKIAKDKGYSGAQFPWESAGTGEEETPEWARDIDRTIIKIHTHEMEDHLTADVAYAIYNYYAVTGDIEFMQDYGYEMLIETARFWASRVEYNRRKDTYEINHVIGPDEFHVDVNNNAFTNMMAKGNLIAVCRIYKEFKKNPAVYREIKNKLNFNDKEIVKWRKIASKITIRINKKGVIEQFDGYFKLKKIILTKTDENGIPLIPNKLGTHDFGKTQLIKQPDVLMLLLLFPDIFNKRTKITNYDFYVSRTAHKSSLSPAMQAIMAGQAGDLQRAYSLFNVALRADISDLYGNTPEGIHAASLGGAWQAVTFGFAGIRLKRGQLFIDPCMPHSWKKIIFCLVWRGQSVKLEVSNDMIKIKISSLQNKIMRIGIFSKLIDVKTNKVCLFKRQIFQIKAEEYY